MELLYPCGSGMQDMSILLAYYFLRCLLSIGESSREQCLKNGLQEIQNSLEHSFLPPTYIYISLYHKLYEQVQIKYECLHILKVSLAIKMAEAPGLFYHTMNFSL